MDTDNVRVTELREELAAARDAKKAATELERMILKQIDEENLKFRPIYPTTQQRVAIREAVAAIKRHDKPKSHLGDPAEGQNYGVVVDGARGWLNIKHGAPYAADTYHQGEYLWKFSPEEVVAIITEIRMNGVGVQEWWYADGSVSILTTFDVTNEGKERKA